MGSPVIEEVSEPTSPDEGDAKLQGNEGLPGPSVLANLLKRSSPPESAADVAATIDHRAQPAISQVPHVAKTTDAVGSSKVPDSSHTTDDAATECTPLLATASSESSYEAEASLEGQGRTVKHSWIGTIRQKSHTFEAIFVHGIKIAASPKKWNGKVLAQNFFFDPLSCLPAVAVGLLLNILDALSYGNWLFSPAVAAKLTIIRHDSLPSGNPSVLSPRVCRYLHLLREHRHLSAGILNGQYLQGGCGIGIGMTLVFS